jgi:hypothetical protein
MLKSLKSFFSPPVFEDPEKSAQAKSIQIILLSTLVLTVLFLFYAIFFPPPGQLIVAVTAIIVEFGLLVLVRSRHIFLASVIFTSMLWIAIVIEEALYGGIRDTGFGTFAAIILIAGLTMGTTSSIIFALLTLIVSAGLAYFEYQNLLPPYVSVPISSVLLSHSISLIAIALLLNLAIRSISSIAHKAIDEIRSKEQANSLLEASQIDLKNQAITLEQRNNTLRTVASISRLSNLVKNENELLEQSVKMIAEENKFEHIRIYLLDQMEEYAILQVSNDLPGKKLSITESRLTVIRSETSSLLLGSGTLQYKVGNWYYFIDPPMQSQEVKTNLIYPLISGEKLIGLMDILSTSATPNLIDPQTIQLLADQIAMSLSNMRMLTQLRGRIQEIGQLEGNAVRSAWDHLMGVGKIGFAYDRLQVIPSKEIFPQGVLEELQSGKSVAYTTTGTSAQARLAAPIFLRGSIIGVIGYDNSNPGHDWQEDEKGLLETISSRVSLALENTRLVAEAQQRADRERMIGQITARMRETLDIETVLKTAVKELRQSLGLSEAEIRMQLADGNDPLGSK